MGLLFLASVCACARSGVIPAGEAGGHCYGNSTCNVGLACVAGVCQPPPAAEPICQNVQCGGRGTCTVVDGQATCSCDAGYFAAGLTCLACSGSPCPPTPNVMFTTSTVQVPGSLGGLAGGDAVCTQRAQAAGLPGTYVAWLSTSSVDAFSRLGTARGWVRTDGMPFVDTVADLINGKIFWPPRFDEFGDDLGLASCNVATGSQGNGTEYLGETCSDFTDASSTSIASVGCAAATGDKFSSDSGGPCSVAVRLYCFEIDHSVPVAPNPVIGRKAFVTSTFFDPGQGSGDISAADAFCNTDASLAGIQGNFRALLTTTAFAGASRFDLTGPTWVRLDGVPLARTAALFMQGQLEAPLNLTPSGQYVTDKAFTGGGPEFPSSNLIYTCGDWTGFPTTGTTGYPSWTDPSVFFSQTVQDACQTGARLYCLEQ